MDDATYLAWVTGELVTATLMNTHLRDNLLETAPAKVTTQGDTLYATGANALARLAKGTALQQYRMNAGATAPEWATIVTTLTGCQVIQGTAQSLNDDDLDALDFASATTDFDSASLVQIASDRLVLTAGIWLLGVQITFASATGVFYVGIKVNGGVHAQAEHEMGAVDLLPRINAGCVYEASASDLVTLEAKQVTGGALDSQGWRLYAIRLGGL